MPADVRRTDAGWRVVYSAGGDIKTNRFELENAAGGAWSLSVDSWDFNRGDRLSENLADNLPKVVFASRFQFTVRQEARPEFGALKLLLAPLADGIDPALVKASSPDGRNALFDLGRDTAVRGISFPAGTDTSGIRVAASYNADILGGGDIQLGRFIARGGREYFEFHTVQRHRYFATLGFGRAGEVVFDAVPYGYALHLTRESWGQKLERLRWWTEARFGMFIHFGLYAIPARHEWVKSNECMADADYRAYFEEFNPVRFDARAWARAAKDAGMKYAVLTTRHHEGFSLFETKFSDYKITNTPFGRDLVREYVDAFRAEGLRVGFYYSLIDWHHPDFTIDTAHPDRKRADARRGAEGDADFTAANASRDMAKYRQFMKDQVTELLTNYGKIDIIWFDFSYPGANGKGRDDWGSEDLLRLVRRLQPEIIVDNRLDLADWEDGWDFATPEQSRATHWPEVNGRRVPWETCQTFSGSWGYHRDEKSWKSAYQCIEQLVSTVSKGGNVIMNVGPTATGEFDYRALERLADYGKWLKVNGDSIYGCTAAPEEFKAPPNTLLTYNPASNRLFMHVLAWHFGTMPIAFGERVKGCRLLNDGSELPFKWNTLHLPVDKPPVEIPVVEFLLK
ncbi:MAG: alpha-L-fucosidase [Kiritimatiellae bacterium]|nr:alpha-L-fucosidase [Kiritimatiellia bacterium]